MVVTPNFRIVLGFGHVPKSAVLACSLFKLDAKVPNCCPSGLFILTPSWELAWLLGLPKLQSICCFSKSTCRLGYAHIPSYNKQTYIYIYFLENSTSSNFLRGCVVTTQMPTENLSHPMKPAMFDPKVVLPTSRSESLSQSCSHFAGGSVEEIPKMGGAQMRAFWGF